MFYFVKSSKIVSGPHTVGSAFVRSLASTGNPELLPLATMRKLGLVPEQRAELGEGQGWGAPELLPDGSAVRLPAVNVPPSAKPVPASITKRQLYRGLMQAGWFGSTMPQIDTAIGTLINGMPAQVREVARVEFFTSRDYLRNNPLLVSALSGPPLSKTSAQIDDFFRLCDSFPAEGL